MFFVVNGRSTASPEMKLVWFSFAFGSASLTDDRVPLLRFILRVTHGRVYTLSSAVWHWQSQEQPYAATRGLADTARGELPCCMYRKQALCRSG